MKRQETPTLREVQDQLNLLRAQGEQLLRQGHCLRNETARLSRTILEIADKQPQKAVAR